MTRITLQDGKVVLRDGKVGTEEACCCGGCPCKTVIWTHVYGGCTNIATQTLTAEAEEDCYAYYRVEDFDCVNPLTGRDCGAGATCDFFARVKINGNQLGPIEYQQPDESWATGGPGGTCDCLDAFGSLAAQINCECPGGGPGLGTLNPDFCGSYDLCCTAAGCVPALFFESDVADCVCYHEGPVPEGSYATYAECCADNFCPDPPP
jgi:hypothetical protein